MELYGYAVEVRPNRGQWERWSHKVYLNDNLAKQAVRTIHTTFKETNGKIETRIIPLYWESGNNNLVS